MPFDPFNDRMARDIRNSLSTALVRELTGSGGDGVAAAAARWLSQPLAATHRDYLRERTQRYRQVLEEIRAAGIRHPLLQAVALWNADLFFELHELLETIWPDAAEPEHTALKGWIQAAGAYLHLARGKPEAAHGLAGRARRHLAAGAAALAFIVNLNELIQDLDGPAGPAPRLEADPARLAGGTSKP
jgi:hypothetical protein